ncbi:hypothetical protein LTR78_006772 [Recurvomyces mirabilis]|uniref:Uncharacterized protein n=1 Tax=Recurvomyces mirabilis TaxID=574656 RepID=A0AAE0WK73_9PEZI|nr:hypothetical protein LTR78_006772 [Recurvomyces mirabilis]KAK5153238.1 hypothetical protein LTS14_007883 [Recurvomyces mirabilis]
MAPTKPTSASKLSFSKPTSATQSGKIVKSSPANRKGKGGGGKKDDEDDNHGFIGPAPRRKEQKMRWDEAADIKLLLFGMDRGPIQRSEHEAIAASFKEKPTAKAIGERLSKLGTEQRTLLKRLGIFDIDAQKPKVQKSGKKGKGDKDEEAEEDEVEEQHVDEEMTGEGDDDDEHVEVDEDVELVEDHEGEESE